jgi:Uri superfamily endonuclease
MGTYVLALWLERARRISVGRRGEFAFPAGWVLYVGSALGPGGLAARLARHRRRFASGKRPHWHVDYVREHAVWGGAWARPAGGRLECDGAHRAGGWLESDGAHRAGGWLESDGARRAGERLECAWAAALSQRPGARIVVPGFGASDCRCPGHLVHLPALPDEAWMASVLGAERVVVGMDELDELLETLVSGDDDRREAAAIALGQFGATAVAPLAALVAAPDADARWWAARALAEVRTAGAVPPLLEVLDDPVPDVRACAALALGRLGDGAGAPALAERLGDESAFVASVAADALSMIGEPAVEALAERLQDESAHARLLAVRALARIKSQSAIGPLFGVLEDPSYLVRFYARQALEALGVGMVFMAP